MFGEDTNMTSVQTGEGHTESEQWFTILETVVLSIAMIFGVFGNLLTIITVSISKQIRTVPNVYVSSLSTSNLLLSGVATPYFIATLWSNTKGIFSSNTKGIFSLHGCKAIAYVTLVLFTITLYNYAAISLNRYIMVTKPKKTYMGLYKTWKVSISIAIIWLVPLLLFTVPFFTLGTYGYDRHREMCLFEEEEYHEETYWYILATDIIGPVLIFLITMVCHLKIMQHFRRSRQRINQKSTGTADDNSAGGSSNTGMYQQYPYMGSTGQLNIPNCSTMGGLNSYSHLVTKQKNKEQHTASIVKNLVLPWVFLLLLRLPLVIVHIIDHHDSVAPVYHQVALTLVFVNPLADFIIYALLNRQMRPYFQAVVNCRSPDTIRYIPH